MTIMLMCCHVKKIIKRLHECLTINEVQMTINEVNNYSDYSNGG